MLEAGIGRLLEHVAGAGCLRPAHVVPAVFAGHRAVEPGRFEQGLPLGLQTPRPVHDVRGRDDRDFGDVEQRVSAAQRPGVRTLVANEEGVVAQRRRRAGGELRIEEHGRRKRAEPIALVRRTSAQVRRLEEVLPDHAGYSQRHVDRGRRSFIVLRRSHWCRSPCKRKTGPGCLAPQRFDRIGPWALDRREQRNIVGQGAPPSRMRRNEAEVRGARHRSAPVADDQVEHHQRRRDRRRRRHECAAERRPASRGLDQPHVLGAGRRRGDSGLSACNLVHLQQDLARRRRACESDPGARPDVRGGAPLDEEAGTRPVGGRLYRRDPRASGKLPVALAVEQRDHGRRRARAHRPQIVERRRPERHVEAGEAERRNLAAGRARRRGRPHREVRDDSACKGELQQVSRLHGHAGGANVDRPAAGLPGERGGIEWPLRQHGGNRERIGPRARRPCDRTGRRDAAGGRLDA